MWLCCFGFRLLLLWFELVQIFRPQRDPYYDRDAEAKDRKNDEEAKKQKQRQTYIKRVIVHPAFHNISYAEAEKVMATVDQGEAIIRPSSKVRNVRLRTEVF